MLDPAPPANMSVDAHIVGRVGDDHCNGSAVVEPCHIVSGPRVAAKQAVAAALAHLPKIATPRSDRTFIWEFDRVDRIAFVVGEIKEKAVQLTGREPG